MADETSLRKQKKRASRPAPYRIGSCDSLQRGRYVWCVYGGPRCGASGFDPTLLCDRNAASPSPPVSSRITDSGTGICGTLINMLQQTAPRTRQRCKVDFAIPRFRKPSSFTFGTRVTAYSSKAIAFDQNGIERCETQPLITFGACYHKRRSTCPDARAIYAAAAGA